MELLRIENDQNRTILAICPNIIPTTFGIITGKIGPLDLLSKRDTPLEAFSDRGSPGEWTVPGISFMASLLAERMPARKISGPAFQSSVRCRGEVAMRRFGPAVAVFPRPPVPAFPIGRHAGPDGPCCVSG